MKKQKKVVRAKRSRAKTSASKYRVRNWSEYNAGLVKRGSLTLWINEDVIRAWQPAPAAKRKRGGQRRFSDSAIEALLTLRAVLHLPLRATQGFAQSILELLDVDLEVPCYTTLSRRGQNLAVALPTLAEGPLHAVLDSTGLKVFGEGEWKVRQHGYSQRRTWRKLHLCVDEATGEPIANMSYRIKRSDGTYEEGTTDHLGHTHLVSSADAESISIEMRK